MRYFLQLAYFGKPFHGWQIQPGLPTVQEQLNKALSQRFKTEINVTGAGRTDTGVHAREMVAHFDLPEAIEDRDFALNQLNKILGPHIALEALWPVPETAHARFDAWERAYEYWIARKKDPFLQDYSAYYGYPLDLVAMQEGAGHLLGEQDFKALSKASDVKHHLCQVREAKWEVSDHLWIFHIRANRFLRNMVRAVVGTLIWVGQGRLSADDIPAILASGQRSNAGFSAPPEGLYLTEIKYPKSLSNG